MGQVKETPFLAGRGMGVCFLEVCGGLGWAEEKEGLNRVRILVVEEERSKIKKIKRINKEVYSLGGKNYFYCRCLRCHEQFTTLSARDVSGRCAGRNGERQGKTI